MPSLKTASEFGAVKVKVDTDQLERSLRSVGIAFDQFAAQLRKLEPAIAPLGPLLSGVLRQAENYTVPREVTNRVQIGFDPGGPAGDYTVIGTAMASGAAGSYVEAVIDPAVTEKVATDLKLTILVSCNMGGDNSSVAIRTTEDLQTDEVVVTAFDQNDPTFSAERRVPRSMIVANSHASTAWLEAAAMQAAKDLSAFR